VKDDDLISIDKEQAEQLALDGIVKKVQENLQAYSSSLVK
jgi:hypothetical protein